MDLESDDDDDDRSSGIQTRSSTAAKRMNDQSDDDQGKIMDLENVSMEYLESEEEETEIDDYESDEEEEDEPILKHPKTRMVTRQMSLIMNHQTKGKANVKVQPFVDHSEDTSRYDNQRSPVHFSFFQ